LPVIADAKTPPPDTIQSKLLDAINLFYQLYPQEKIHLQFNKNKYAPGDDIWFSSYLMPFRDTSYSTYSRIEYVELIDMNNTLVKRLVLPVENGVAEGHFKLGALFNEGVYHVRAYTAWMLNFDSLFFFNRDIPVVAGNAYPGNSPVNKNYVVSFYPEGGNLVMGLTSLVAYKAEDEDGNPVSIAGKITDDKGNTRALLHTGSDGLGNFNMHPEEGFNYTATIDLGNGLTRNFALPAIKKSGVVLHVVDRPDSANNSQLYFHIARSKAEKELYSNIIICAHTAKYNRLLNINFDPKYAGDYNDTILFAADPLDIKNEGQDIAHITVFNKNGEPLADRMIFLHNGNPFKSASVLPVNESLTGENAFTLQVPGDSQGQYSVSVTTDDDVAAESAESNILSDFYLPGIQNNTWLPAAYFIDTAETYSRLNLVLLTHKWDYFSWPNMLARHFPQVTYLPEQSLILKGSVTVEKYGKAEAFAEKTIPLLMRNDKDSIRTFLNVPVDDKGNFIENNLYFHDTASFYYQSNQQKSKKVVTVTFNKTETDSVLALPFHYKPYRNSFANYINPAKAPATAHPASPQPNITDSGTLKAVTVNATAKSHMDSLDDAYTSGIFSGNRTFVRTFDLTEDNITENDHVSNVLQYLQGRVPGLMIQGDVQNLPEIYWRLTAGLFTNNRAVDPIGATILNMPVFFIDERQINTNELIGGAEREELGATMSQLTTLKVADIAYIKVYEPGTFYGAEGGAAHGAIAVYLKKGYKTNENVNSATRQGYTYIPSFAGNALSRPDKQAIYWNPAVHTNPQTHTATINFTNNTGAKKIKIVVEGIDKKGSLVRIEKIFEQQ
jgi:hypothetical protein